MMKGRVKNIKTTIMMRIMCVLIYSCMAKDGWKAGGGGGGKVRRGEEGGGRKGRKRKMRMARCFKEKKLEDVKFWV